MLISYLRSISVLRLTPIRKYRYWLFIVYILITTLPVGSRKQQTNSKVNLDKSLNILSVTQNCSDFLACRYIGKVDICDHQSYSTIALSLHYPSQVKVAPNMDLLLKTKLTLHCFTNLKSKFQHKNVKTSSLRRRSITSRAANGCLRSRPNMTPEINRAYLFVNCWAK